MGWKEKEAAKLEGKRVLLVVGAGGIGCELLKNLALTGYKDIHVIDMDTIDVSNLNRQFLFRREHVGRSKAEVATEAIRQLRPDIKITFDLDSIFSSKFNLTFFQQFFLVMNALDNRAARNHVNRMCLAAKIPLIESGSSGYLGQVINRSF
ncbi:ThiF family protein [Cooperia oncophora]